MKNRKGIVLAGGLGTRLFPATKVISKQLLPIYNKPMIYYPISCLMLAGIKDILIISSPEAINLIKKLLGNGKDIGVSFSYKVQKKPNGIAQAILLAEQFLKGSPCTLILGDNIFYGNNLEIILKKMSMQKKGAGVVTYTVNVPERYGVAEIKNKKVIKIVEKPKKPKSNFAVTGIYFYDSNAVKYAKQIKPSARGELEITDLNNIYAKKNKLTFKHFGRGIAWLDTGTPSSLLDAGKLVETIEKRQDLLIGSIEEIAYKNKWVTKEKLKNKLSKFKSDYYTMLLKNL